jgi:hypothetical protein
MGSSIINRKRTSKVSSPSTSHSASWPRHRWISVGVVITGILLTVLAGLRLGGGLPDLPKIRSANQEAANHPFQSLVNRPDLTSVNSWPKMNDESNPFYTDFFKPAPKPAPPPKSTMKQVEVLYQGWFESSNKELEAFVTIDKKKFHGGLDKALGPEFTLLEIHSDFIRLKSNDDQEHRVPFSKPTQLKIPTQ